jgi:hypothetical protein
VLGAYPALATTHEITPAERARLLLQIERLRYQLTLLQARLADLSQSRGEPLRTYGESIPLEASYLVTAQNTLTPQPVHTNHQSLFYLWNAVIGTSTTARMVDTWQIFNDASTNLGAYVETLGSGDDWRVAINRAGYDPRSLNERRIFAELFIHEYAHMLYVTRPDFTTAFGEQFWTDRDRSHSEGLINLSLDDRFTRLSTYYERHQSRFVSEYATMNVDEDMAETFLTLVVSPALDSDLTIKARKQRFLLRDQKTAATVVQLRANLRTLGLM